MERISHRPHTTESSTTERSTVISRRPAAIVGMVIVLTIGFTFFKGVDNLTGQLATPSGPSIIISDSGVLPKILQVEHGQTIRFINNSDTSHQIASNTLCSDTGFCLQTNLLERGQSDVFSITPDMQSGTYEYTSLVSGDIRGSIQIITQTVNEFTDLSSILQDGFPPPPINENSNTSVANVGIPRNPYTVGNEQLGPFNSLEPTSATTSNTEELFPAATAAQTAFAQTRGPIRQPQTGAEHWFIVVLSIGLLWRSTRHLFAVSQ